MQTPKASSWGVPSKSSPQSIVSEASPKNSPQAASSETSQKASPRVARQLKTGPRYSEHTASSSNLASRPPKERSPKVADNRSPGGSASSERKHPSKVAELKSQISQLENDLKTVKDQLCSTESAKKQVQKDAEESNKQLAALSLKLEEFNKQEVVQSERVQKVEQSDDSTALAAALDEIEQLKGQLRSVAKSEAANSEHTEICKLKESLSEAHLLMEDMKNQLKESKESESQAQALVDETLMQLDSAKKMVEVLKTDGIKATETYKAVAAELEESRARVKYLEELASKHTAGTDSVSEVEELKSALEAAEISCKEEREQSAAKVRDVLELVEKMKSETSQREDELAAEIQRSKYEIEELKGNLMDKETELQGICEENEGLAMKLESTLSGQRESAMEREVQNLRAEIESMRSSLSEKEKMWRNVMDENEKLKLEKKEIEVVSEIEAATAVEKEAVMKVGYMAEELDKSNRKAARAAEQLEAAQAANTAMEAELRKVKVQSDQWRKAAEAAAAMLNNGQLMERTGSMDSHYSPQSGKIGGLPYGDEMEDDLLKKKNANMLRRIGILWKKQQK
ncbi:interactor of constitutive active ROPs 3-like isoform X2 [Andrographis paniculata]|uniref:interactor of constitutive active ROPs 3-like isoform X2 n=1 Tax=Andrographis paniculata TaxID=175694 RepID=UPI0021E8C4DB|nr:interactor of constitutive active ROPs 3-like isoform X2 [Andrographis paniculata]